MRLALLGIVLWNALAAATDAAVVLSDDFSGGTFHLPWTFADENNNSPPDATTISASQNDLRFTTTPPAFDGLASGIVAPGNPSFMVEDVLVRATVFALPNTPKLSGGSALSDNDIAVAVRLDPSQGRGYTLTVDYLVGHLTLSRLDPTLQVTDLVSHQPIPGFDPTKHYTVEFLAVGSQLTGRVFDGTNPLLTIATSDGTYASGWVGLGARINNNQGRQTYIGAGFDDFEAIVPEPSTLVLAAIAALGLIATARGQRRRSRARMLAVGSPRQPAQAICR